MSTASSQAENASKDAATANTPAAEHDEAAAAAAASSSSSSAAAGSGDDDGLIVVVTGANAGVGYACVEQLLASDRVRHVVLIGRNADRCEAALRRLDAGERASVEVADMADAAAVDAACAAILGRLPHVDALVSNAATFDITVKKPTMLADGHEVVFATNHLGPARMFARLARSLASRRGRVLTISSAGLIAHPGLRINFDDLERANKPSAFSTPTAYYNSKLAQCCFARELDRRWADIVSVGVKVTSVAIPDERLPEGLSSFTKWVFKQKRKHALTPEQQARTYTFLLLDADADTVRGAYVDHHNKLVSWPRGSDDEATRERLWTKTKEMLGEAGELLDM